MAILRRLQQIPSLAAISRAPFLLARRQSSSSSSQTSGDGSSPPSDAMSPSYLVEACGLSKDAAEVAFKRIDRRNSGKARSNADAVIAFLRSRGLSTAQIAKAVRNRPEFLFSDVEKTLKPKIDFLINLGLDDAGLRKVISRNPTFLQTSLEERIAPSFGFLKAVLAADANVMIAVQRAPRLLHVDLDRCVSPKLDLLRAMGVPETRISKILRDTPSMFLFSSARFDEMLEKVKEMGVLPTAAAFGPALYMFSFAPASLERKLDAFRSFGLSQSEILSCIRAIPTVMNLSEGSIREKMEFFTKSLKWEPQYVISKPVLLCMSLERRIKPRASVIDALESEGILSSSSNTYKIYIIKDDIFVRDYVLKFIHLCPSVMNVYKGC